jgi:prepilin-type N-terminal cleavage/methylation domain-containing protein
LNAAKARALRGLTLVEMIVTVAIVAVITVAVTESVIMFYKTNRIAFEESYQIRSAERGLQVLVRDLREATYGDDGAYPLAAIASSSIIFYADVDRTNPVEKVTYTLTGKLLKRTVTSSTGNPPTYTGAVATSTVSEYVRNFDDNLPLFRYFDAAGAEITGSSDIVRIVSVSINLIVDITPFHAPGEFTLKSGATLRNLRPQ